MYDYGYYDYGYGGIVTGLVAGFAIFGIILWVISMVISIFTLVCMWKIFKKAGKPGWASIVPIYNIIVILEITELPMWYIALLLIPFANIYAMVKIYIEFAKKFGKSAGFGIGIFFLAPIFLGILAFDKAVSYVGNQKDVQSEQTVQSNMDQNSTSNFCSNCGKSLIPGAKFCTGCGKQI